MDSLFSDTHDIFNSGSNDRANQSNNNENDNDNNIFEKLEILEQDDEIEDVTHTPPPSPTNNIFNKPQDLLLQLSEEENDKYHSSPKHISHSHSHFYEEPETKTPKETIYVPYKYIISSSSDFSSQYTVSMWSRSVDGNFRKEIIFDEYDSFILIENTQKPPELDHTKKYFIDQYKDFFNTTNVRYLETDIVLDKSVNQKIWGFIISPYSNIPSNFLKNNSHRIIKVPRSIYNLNCTNDRSFFEYIDGSGDKSDMQMEIPKHPYKNFFTNNIVNFSAFKTVLWSVINLDTIIFMYYDSSLNDSYTINPYDNIFVWSSNTIFNYYLDDENNYNTYIKFIENVFHTKNITIKLLKDFDNIPGTYLTEHSEEEIFVNYFVPSFIDFISQNIDIAVNYGETTDNYISNIIFNKLNTIPTLQNIDIKKYIKTFNSFYSDHSINNFCTEMDLTSINESGNNIINTCKDIIINKYSNNLLYSETYLAKFLTSSEQNNIEKISVKENVESFTENIFSRILIISNIWMYYSKQLFDISHYSNTNFNDITSNTDEIIRGMVCTNLDIFQSTLLDFSKLTSPSNYLKKNYYMSNILTSSSIPLYLKFIENNPTHTPIESFVLKTFSNPLYTGLYWIFNRFLDSYNISNNLPYIDNNSFKRFKNDFLSQSDVIGEYNGMLYYKCTKHIEDYFHSNSLSKFYTSDDNITNFWNFMFILDFYDSWIGIKIDSDNTDKKYSFSYFGDNLVCKQRFSAIRNVIEWYFVFYITQHKTLDIKSSDLFEYNIQLTENNTYILTYINEFNIELFENSIQSNLSNINTDKLYKVWYDHNGLFTLSSSKMNKKIYINKIKNLIINNIDKLFDKYKNAKSVVKVMDRHISEIKVNTKSVEVEKDCKPHIMENNTTLKTPQRFKRRR